METKPNQIQVRIDPAAEQGVYANAVSVHSNPAEITVDFGYILPASNPTTIKVVNRITMSRSTAESLSNVLTDALKGEKKNQ